MSEVATHLQCQTCHATFETSRALHGHLNKYRVLAERIRTWDEQCRAHLEPGIEPDPGLDDLDTELCRNNPALMNARACPVEGCDRQFREKKQLNVHFESHEECSETCVVCHTTFTRISKFMAHTIHSEAITRHRSYIKTARDELRKEARDRLHRLLIKAFNSEHRATKRGPEEAELDGDRYIKRAGVLERDDEIILSVNDLQVHGSMQYHPFMGPPDPFAPRVYLDNNASMAALVGNIHAPPLYEYQTGIDVGYGQVCFSQQASNARLLGHEGSEDIQVTST